MRKARKALCVCALACLLICLFFPSCSAEEVPCLRALLIGCDHFLTQADTSPAAENNIDLLARALLQDDRGYTLVRTLPNAVAAPEEMAQVIRETFGEATETDVSLLYISTHGVYEEGEGGAEAALLLSDGQKESLLTADALAEMLDAVPGQKVLILDACHSGAFIGKGLSGPPDAPRLSGPSYKVLCSAGGSEASWYWQSTDAVSGGASYFATVLADAIGVNGDYGADANADGRITLAELYGFIRENYAASTPQVYPQDDAGFLFFSYDPLTPAPLNKTVTDIVFEDTLLTAGQCEVSFSFTVRRAAKVYYQLVYHEDGMWQFGTAQHFLDAEEPDGTILPGRKARTLCLDTGDAQFSGYVMLQFITMGPDGPSLEGSRLLCVQPSTGDALPALTVSPAFTPENGQEACIVAAHDVPCGLTVSIRDADGQTVRRLAYASPTRPQQLSPTASTFYWDGKDDRGVLCAPGRYTAEVKTRIGEKEETAQSAPFVLLAADDKAPLP